jgi:hypothetical protein
VKAIIDEIYKVMANGKNPGPSLSEESETINLIKMGIDDNMTDPNRGSFQFFDIAVSKICLINKGNINMKSGPHIISP